MNTAINFLRQHPVITIVYFIYALPWFSVIRVSRAHDHLTGMARLSVGEGLVFLSFFALFITAIYLLVTLAQALLLKDKRKLYLILALFILIPAVLITVIGYL